MLRSKACQLGPPIVSRRRFRFTAYRSRLNELEQAFFAALPAIGVLEVLARFILRALGVITSSDRKLIFVNGALSLPSDIEDLAEVDVRPDQRPLRLLIAV